MSSRVTGAGLAVIAVALLAVSAATPAVLPAQLSLFAGHPTVASHTRTTQDVYVGLYSAQLCNVGGDGTCKTGDATLPFRLCGYAELALTAGLALLAVVLALLALRRSESRKTVARLMWIVGGLAIADGAALVLLGPFHGASAPIGIGLFIHGAGLLAAVLGAAFASRPPPPIRLRVADRASQPNALPTAQALDRRTVREAGQRAGDGADRLGFEARTRPPPQPLDDEPLSDPFAPPLPAGERPTAPSGPQLRPLYEAAPLHGGTGGLVPPERPAIAPPPPPIARGGVAGGPSSAAASAVSSSVIVTQQPSYPGIAVPHAGSQPGIAAPPPFPGVSPQHPGMSSQPGLAPGQPAYPGIAMQHAGSQPGVASPPPFPGNLSSQPGASPEQSFLDVAPGVPQPGVMSGPSHNAGSPSGNALPPPFPGSPHGRSRPGNTSPPPIPGGSPHGRSQPGNTSPPPFPGSPGRPALPFAAADPRPAMPSFIADEPHAAAAPFAPDEAHAGLPFAADGPGGTAPPLAVELRPTVLQTAADDPQAIPPPFSEEPRQTAPRYSGTEARSASSRTMPPPPPPARGKSPSIAPGAAPGGPPPPHAGASGKARTQVSLVPPMPDNDLPIAPPTAQIAGEDALGAQAGETSALFPRPETPLAPPPLPVPPPPGPRARSDSQLPPPLRGTQLPRPPLRAAVPMPARPGRAAPPTQPPAPGPAQSPVPSTLRGVPLPSAISTSSGAGVPAIPVIPAIPPIPAPRRPDTDVTDPDGSADADLDAATVSRVPIEVGEYDSQTNVSVDMPSAGPDAAAESTRAGYPVDGALAGAPPATAAAGPARTAGAAAADQPTILGAAVIAARPTIQIAEQRPDGLPVAPSPSRTVTPHGRGSMPNLPISTAPDSLPPPKDHKQALGPTPACPQCESPMAWVEEHLRFYCKSCRMYF